MSNGSSRSSIFLSIVIVFLLVAMGVYGFIYRDKLGEFFQKFQKKNEQVEKVTIYNNESLSDNNTVTTNTEPKSEPETPKPKLKDIPLETEDSPKAEIESMVYENVPGDDAPKKKKSKLEFKNNVPDRESTGGVEESAPKMEFKQTGQKNKKLSSKKTKRKFSSKKQRKGSSALLARVNRLERALGIKSNKRLSLEKRIERLEKKLKQ